ncbi:MULTISPECIES: GAF domain-containing protein [Pseudanabaena]|uniref:GAF domain protein n=2 Tax=Pseudanabaena TaxID=1152 RepID=L8N689_9CYAN|nr:MULTISPECIES: GAF domain-containing protein [Pseudanabaena]ELS33738.1 GAF domain protein [Pseudanabaena biceps PCC 7429]MDG3494075.1 GAF domain-containing protein [Pseudanabaena catenata USMAC16]
MDSTLLDQIRHLCRDRAAYERLKAILVQQERVHQLSWEEHQEKMMATEAVDGNASDIFSNIIAREKALAQLADAIQRSPSLDLVLQIAVQVAQQLLQVDRVALFHCHANGQAQFVTDAIATGLISLTSMPERQLSLARHMIESTEPDHSAQIVDSIRSSSLSSHIVTLLEQIGISSYVANKIYAGQEVWGTLVAFHGRAYHNWSESDRTSLSLVAAQIGIAISLVNLRQQSQELTDDLHSLRLELDNLQQIVTEIAESATNPDNTEDIAPLIAQAASASSELVSDDAESDHDQKDGDPVNSDLENLENLENEEEQSQEIELAQTTIPPVEAIDFQDIPNSQNGVPPLFLAPVANNDLPELEGEDDEEPSQEAVAIKFARADISYVIMPDNLKVISSDESEESDLNTTIESPEQNSEQNPEQNPEPEVVEFPIAAFPNQPSENLDLADPLANAQPEAIATAPIRLPLDQDEADLSPREPEAIVDEFINPEQEEILPEITEPQLIEPEILELASEPIDLPSPEPEILALASEPIDQPPSESALPDDTQGVDTQEELDIAKEEEEPAIEPQFIETILEIAGNDRKATEFLIDVIDAYLEDAPHLVQAIDRSLAVSDYVKLLQALNTLRSSSDYLGALTLSYQCRQLESAVNANYIVLIYASLSQVAIEVQRATDALRQERSRYLDMLE